MLFRQCVEVELLQLLEALQKLDFLKEHFLVGGTALSLYRGHRKSEDIDLFTSKDFYGMDTYRALKDAGLDVAERVSFDTNRMVTQINGIKVDIWKEFGVKTHLKPIQQIEGIRMLSLEDISAQKIMAAQNRNAKKDYVDLIELHKLFGFKQCVQNFKKRYAKQNESPYLARLKEVDLGDIGKDPLLLNKEFNWGIVKSEILDMINTFERTQRMELSKGNDMSV
ncbi:MAG: nucleotidyl transferase AbiEii/AbiGii toxin family protein [Bacteroidota bacterium]|nr:nucleotidyl transferase AbiEii/AbiGii toxin family protein [Bacteroidota bacterium]